MSDTTGVSLEDVEIVRRIFHAVARHDPTVLDLYDPDVEMRFAPGTLADPIVGGSAVWRGHDGIRRWNRELRQAFESFETTCEELIDLGEHVLSVSKYRAHGRLSGITIDGPAQFILWTIRAGRVMEGSLFPTREQALQAAGVQE